MKKTLFTLNIDNYCPELRAITYPLMKYYADKIRADFYEITERKFIHMPVTYEKMQIYDLAKELKSDWNIFVDADALINPEAPDWTMFMNKNTVAHNGCDLSLNRYRPDEYFMRDGRGIGSCNWFTIASDLCLDLWHPLELDLYDAVENIFPNNAELNGVVTRSHLIDDYTLSRNIAKFGLKFETIPDIQVRMGHKGMIYLWHIYNVSDEGKIKDLPKTLDTWKVPLRIRNYKQ